MIRDTSAQDRVLAKPAHGKPWRRWVGTAVIALVVLGGIGYLVRGWLGASKSVDGSRVRIARVERGNLVRDIVADGRVVAANSPTLYAIAPGTVEFLVRPGDKVVKGQRLALIASPELQSRLTQEQATLAGIEAGVGRAGLDVEHGKANAQKALQQAEVDRQAASREVELNQQMFDKGVIPEVELRRSQDQLKKAEIAVAHARTEAGLQNKELVFELGTKTQGLDRQRAVVKELERQVAALAIESPFDGQVGQLAVAQRASVPANAPILSVVDLSTFELEIQVPDSFARDLALGMSAEIKSNGTTFPGTVRSVSPEVIGGNVATRLELGSSRPTGMRQNQRMSARILIEEKKDVLKVERGPWVEAGGGNVAYVMVDGVAERRTVKTGAVSLDAVEIQAGLQVGDQIVVAGTDAFADAQRVRIAN